MYVTKVLKNKCRIPSITLMTQQYQEGFLANKLGSAMMLIEHSKELQKKK
jgi:hypothetical protein